MKLKGKNVAILMTDGVEDSEFRVPYKKLIDEHRAIYPTYSDYNDSKKQ